MKFDKEQVLAELAELIRNLDLATDREGAEAVFQYFEKRDLLISSETVSALYASAALHGSVVTGIIYEVDDENDSVDRAEKYLTETLPIFLATAVSLGIDKSSKILEGMFPKGE